MEHATHYQSAHEDKMCKYLKDFTHPRLSQKGEIPCFQQGIANKAHARSVGVGSIRKGRGSGKDGESV